MGLLAEIENFPDTLEFFPLSSNTSLDVTGIGNPYVEFHARTQNCREMRSFRLLDNCRIPGHDSSPIQSCRSGESILN